MRLFTMDCRSLLVNNTSITRELCFVTFIDLKKGTSTSAIGRFCFSSVDKSCTGLFNWNNHTPEIDILYENVLNEQIVDLNIKISVFYLMFVIHKLLHK